MNDKIMTGPAVQTSSEQTDHKSSPHPLLLGLRYYLSSVRQEVPEQLIRQYEHPEDEVAQSPRLRVMDVMTRKVTCVLPSTTVEQVASLCNRRGFSGVPVVDEQHSLLGIVTLNDIMRQLLSHDSLSTFAASGGEVLEQKALGILDEPVRNYMHSEVITIEPEASVQEACQLMRKHGIRRLVVSRGKLVKGIFSARDAVAVLARGELRIEMTET